MKHTFGPAYIAIQTSEVGRNSKSSSLRCAPHSSEIKEAACWFVSCAYATQERNKVQSVYCAIRYEVERGDGSRGRDQGRSPGFSRAGGPCDRGCWCTR